MTAADALTLAALPTAFMLAGAVAWAAWKILKRASAAVDRWVDEQFGDGMGRGE